MEEIEFETISNLDYLIEDWEIATSQAIVARYGQYADDNDWN